MSSPTARTLQWCKANGFIAGVTEKWQASFGKTEDGKPRPGGVRKDLFGFIDIISMEGQRICANQVTSAGNMAARKAKIEAECKEAALEWMRSGGVTYVIGWRKRKLKTKTGGIKVRWVFRRERFAMNTDAGFIWLDATPEQDGNK